MGARIEHQAELGAWLEPIFRTRSADAWEKFLTAADIGCVRADKSAHVRYL